MRSRYIITYDISDQKRLRRMFNKMRGFGNPLQYSVFLCELSLKEKVILASSLEEIINHKEDRVIIMSIGGTEERIEDRIEFMGKRVEFQEHKAVVF